MKQLLSLVLLLAVHYSVWSDTQVESPARLVNGSCEDTVDAVDSLDFADNIVECGSAAVLLYDPASLSKFLRASAQPTEVYGHGVDASAVAAADNNSEPGMAPAHIPGATFVTRVGYQFAAPHLAFGALYTDMHTYCPLGWRKLREWSRPVDSKASYLYFEFECEALVE